MNVHAYTELGRQRIVGSVPEIFKAPRPHGAICEGIPPELSLQERKTKMIKKITKMVIILAIAFVAVLAIGWVGQLDSDRYIELHLTPKVKLN